MSNWLDETMVDMSKHRCQCGEIPTMEMNKIVMSLVYLVRCKCGESTGNRVFLTMNDAVKYWDRQVKDFVETHADGFEEGDYWYDYLHPNKAKKNDLVNSPEHYMQHEFECIDEMVIMFGVEAVINHCKCCAWKYRYREHYKGQEDLDHKKADWYIRKALQLENGEKYEFEKRGEE